MVRFGRDKLQVMKDLDPVSLDVMRQTLDPRRFIGRAPQQVDEFLNEIVEPLIEQADDSTLREEVRV